MHANSTLAHLDRLLAETEHDLVCKAKQAAQTRHDRLRAAAADAATFAHVVGIDWDGCPILADDIDLGICENLA